MTDGELNNFCSVVASECTAPGMTGSSNLAGGIFDVVKGLKAKGLNWITILQYLPTIISAIQTLGPKVQEIIELVSNLINNIKPQPTPPVVNPLG